MKRQALIMSAFTLFIFMGAFEWSSCSSKKNAAATSVSEPVKTTETKTDPPFIKELKEKIKGKENLPAEEVFENIQILKGIPAGRVIPIMQMAFNGSLGVQCNHCHEFGKWASDVKATKQIAREMWTMTRSINNDLLSEIKNLSSEQPVVNCTTCHRGQVKPVPNK